MTIVPTRGAKHTCSSCATRFYDLGKRPISCPKCNQLVPVVIAPVRRKRRTVGDSTSQERSDAKHMVIVNDPKPKLTKWKTGYLE